MEEEYEEHQESDAWYSSLLIREHPLYVWREWVLLGRPDPGVWCHYAWFDPDDPVGGYDEDGAPYGVHPWTRPRPRGFHWAVLRELLRHRNIATYWYHLIHVPSAAGAAPLTQQQAFEADGF